MIYKSISIIIPVYNSADCLDELTNQLKNELINQDVKIICINDHSTDNSWDLLKDISIHNKNIIAINLSKNFGQDCAIMAGLNHANSDFAIIMDDDLQHSPSDILPLISQLEKAGANVCYGKYINKKQSLFKNFGSWLNDKLANIVIKKPKSIYMSPFKALSRSTVEKIIQYDGPYPYIDGLIFRFTSTITELEIKHHSRFAGKSNYSLYKSISLWLRVLTNFSIIPLRISTYVGMVSSIVGFILGIFFIAAHFIGIESPEGWPSLIVSILFIGGIQLMGLGIIGEYVGRSFLYQSKEPQYVIKEIVGIDG
jgi:glycosyltransferase involved in cell wall biosynthesis